MKIVTPQIMLTVDQYFTKEMILTGVELMAVTNFIFIREVVFK